MRRRIFLLHSLLLLCFMVTVVPSYGYNEYFTVDGITYSYNGWGRCTATGVIDSTDVVRIPDTVVDDGQTLKVVELSFYGRLPLRHGEVYCPKWLEQISGGCFNYTDIVAIHFQENESVEELKIYGNTFISSKLKEISFPSHFKRVMGYTFFECDSLQTIIWSPNVWRIDEYSFYKCSSLREVRLPDNLEIVYQEAFKFCPLETVWLGRGMKTIKEGAFNTADLVDVQHVYAPTGRLAACSVQKVGYNQSFQGKNGVVVHVPVGTIDLFEQSEDWSSYQLQEDASLVEQHKVMLTVNDADSGMVLLDGAELIKGRLWVANHGKAVTITAQPQGNCKLRCCIINGIDVSDQFDAEGCFTIDEVNEETEIYISFNSPSTFTPFTIKQAGSGHIDLQVYHNEPLKLNVTPDNGWVINSVTVNGIDITKKLDGNGDFTIYRVNGGIVVGSAPNRVPIPSSAVSTAGDELTTFVAFEKSTDSVNELFSKGTVKVYGSKEQLCIEGVNKGETVRVYDTAGRLVAHKVGNGGSLTINVPSGIYLVQSGNTTIKIII